MFAIRITLIKYIFSFIAIAFLLVGVFGMSQIGANVNGTNMKCPFANHSESLCKMNPMEHLQEWQSMFTTLPIKNTIFSLLYVLLALLGLRFFRNFSLIDIPQPKRHINFYYLRDFFIRNPIKEAFSSGILNPKIF